MNKKVIVIIGPTASGKTDFAHKMAKNIDGEIINADSRQIYKGLEILTASPDSFLKNELPYHLFNFLNLDQNFSAFEWKKLAISKIEEILKRQKTPIIVGGTMMYIDCLVKNYIPPKTENIDKNLRSYLVKELNEKGREYIYKMLKKLDPNTYVHPNNTYHLLRNLEICLSTGKSASQQKKTGPRLYDFEVIGINIDKQTLKEKIKKRSEFMVSDESINQFERALSMYDINILKKIIGAQELYDFISKKISKSECIEKITQKTVQYAKRQLTWWKKDNTIKWI